MTELFGCVFLEMTKRLRSLLSLSLFLDSFRGWVVAVTPSRQFVRPIAQLHPATVIDKNVGNMRIS